MIAGSLRHFQRNIGGAMPSLVVGFHLVPLEQLILECAREPVKPQIPTLHAPASHAPREMRLGAAKSKAQGAAKMRLSGRQK